MADNAALYSDRIKIWDELNTAWLDLLQKQRDVTLGLSRSSEVGIYWTCTLPMWTRPTVIASLLSIPSKVDS